MNLIVRKYKMTVATHKTAAVMVSARMAGSRSSSVSQRVYIINSTVRLWPAHSVGGICWHLSARSTGIDSSMLRGWGYGNYIYAWYRICL